MDQHFTEYFHEFSEESPSGNFHRVMALHEGDEEDWNQLAQKVPNLPRGWYELAHLSSSDRIELVHDFWESKLPYRPNFSEFLDRFFSELDDIGVYVTQKLFDDPFEAQLVYSVAGNSGFFRGAPPATNDEIASLQMDFADITFPDDYLAFLQVHNGFYKTTDVTGIYPAHQMPLKFNEFQTLFTPEEAVYTKNDMPVNPKLLIPFYESFGMPFYQCFLAEWYPEQEMGNVYFSGKMKAVSDISKGGRSIDHMAFSTFSDWLAFYLEKIS